MIFNSNLLAKLLTDCLEINVQPTDFRVASVLDIDADGCSFIVVDICLLFSNKNATCVCSNRAVNCVNYKQAEMAIGCIPHNFLLAFFLLPLSDHDRFDDGPFLRCKVRQIWTVLHSTRCRRSSPPDRI